MNKTWLEYCLLARRSGEEEVRLTNNGKVRRLRFRLVQQWRMRLSSHQSLERVLRCRVGSWEVGKTGWWNVPCWKECSSRVVNGNELNCFSLNSPSHSGSSHVGRNSIGGTRLANEIDRRSPWWGSNCCRWSHSWNLRDCIWNEEHVRSHLKMKHKNQSRRWFRNMHQRVNQNN